MKLYRDASARPTAVETGPGGRDGEATGRRVAFGNATQYIKGSRIGPVHIFDRAGTVQRVAREMQAARHFGGSSGAA